MDLLHLPWLATAPLSLRDQVRALRRSPQPAFAELRRLATHRLDLSQLSLLARACTQAAEAGVAPVLHLHMLSNATPDLAGSAITATAPRHGLLLKVSTGAFGNWRLEALDPASDTARLRPEFVLLALDWRAFDLEPCPGDANLAEQRVRGALDQLLSAARALVQQGAGQVLVQTLAEPVGSLFGSMDRVVPGSLRWMVLRFNQLLGEGLFPGLLLLDVAQIAAQVGSARWHDPGLWFLGKFAMATQALPLYADHVCRVLMASRGLARKCLVLDLDNTLWGGVIGDDGMGGIVVGQGSATGEAHLAVQACALALRQRGVILAVSSKNEDSIARQVLREHPDMLLRDHHVAAFFANWQDKASNLQAIARTLNIGVDALVLLDDNPSERHQVRQALPEVAVPELPDAPEHYAMLLQAAGYFESVQFTDDDLRRAELYQQATARKVELVAPSDLAEYLASLDMVAELSAFDALSRARVTQLINKTNQFNLTTIRRSELEVAALEQDPSVVTLQVRLKDRFGDNGIICVVIGRQADDELLIDTWLMSCRVLNRGVECAVLNHLVDIATARNIRCLVGRYVATAKNALVSNHYASLGFVAVADPTEQVGDKVRWVLDLANHQARACQVRVQQRAAPIAGA